MKRWPSSKVMEKEKNKTNYYRNIHFYCFMWQASKSIADEEAINKKINK